MNSLHQKLEFYTVAPTDIVELVVTENDEGKYTLFI